MRALPYSSLMGLLLVILTACTASPAPPTRPTRAEIPADLAFSAPLVQLLRQAGLSVLAVQSSTYMAMFRSTDKAAWIKTDQGVVDAVFFADAAEAGQVRITPQPNGTVGRYLYTIRAPAPTLLQDQTIDSAFPLYFTVAGNMFMVTTSAELDTTLQSAVPEP
jgi:hypothetical protein